MILWSFSAESLRFGTHKQRVENAYYARCPSRTPVERTNIHVSDAARDRRPSLLRDISQHPLKGDIRKKLSDVLESRF